MADVCGGSSSSGVEQVGVSWAGFDVSFRSHIVRLLDIGRLADVTLSNGTENVKCHRIMLAACSPYFEKLFADSSFNNNNAHIVILLKDVESWEINAVVNFIYTGRAQAPKNSLGRLFDLAKSLQLRGFDTEKKVYKGQQKNDSKKKVIQRRRQQVEGDDGGGDSKCVRSEQKSDKKNYDKTLSESSVLSEKNSAKSREVTESFPTKTNNTKSDVGSETEKKDKWNVAEQRRNPVENGKVKSGVEQLKQNGSENVEGDNKVHSLKRKLDHYKNEGIKWKQEQRKVEEPNRSISADHPVNQDELDKSEQQNVQESELKSEQLIKTEHEDDQEYIEVGFEDLVEVDTTETEVLELKERPEPQTSRARKGLGKPARSFTVVGERRNFVLKGGRKVYKYEKWERDQALSALEGGLSLRQCSDVLKIPRKTLAKWRGQSIFSESHDNADGEDVAGPSKSQQGLNVFFTEPPITYPPLDGNDRADRLKKAASLALAGVTVRQAAVHYALPRTTLCAYMKRQGLSGPKKPVPAATSRNNTAAISNNSVGVKREEISQDSSEGFPFLGLSELVDNSEANEWPVEQYYVVDDEIECVEDDDPQTGLWKLENLKF